MNIHNWYSSPIGHADKVGRVTVDIISLGINSLIMPDMGYNI